MSEHAAEYLSGKADGLSICGSLVQISILNHGTFLLHFWIAARQFIL